MAKEMHRKYIRGYACSALKHDEFDSVNLAEIKGYEYYGALSQNISKYGVIVIGGYVLGHRSLAEGTFPPTNTLRGAPPTPWGFFLSNTMIYPGDP